MSTIEKLTPKQQVFVSEYCSDGNGRRAVKEAGYKGSDATLSARVTKLLGDPRIQKAIAEVGNPRMERANLTTERILQQLHDFLNLDPAELFDEEGYLQCDMRQLPPHVRQCITGFEVEEFRDKEGNVTKKIKVKTADKVKCLELAMKYKKLFTDTNVTNIHQNNFWEGFYNVTTVQPSPLEEKLRQINAG